MRKKLISERKEHGYTQQSFAEKIGVSRSTVASYETGAIEPSLSICLKIKVELNYFNDNLFDNVK